MSKFRHLFLKVLGAKLSIALLVIFCIISFFLGQLTDDMNLFASSGAIISVFGLLYTIKFTTLKKLSNREAEIASRSGVTGPPLSQAESERIRKENIERARIDVKEEISSEVIGVGLTILGTFIWAYGGYIKIFPSLVGRIKEIIDLFMQ